MAAEGLDPLTTEEYFRVFSQATRTTSGAVDRVVLTGTLRGRVTALWKNTPGTITYSLAATAAQATRVYPDGHTEVLTPSSGYYSLQLAGATNNNNFSGDPNDYIIGGEPIILVEASAAIPPPRPRPR